MARLVRFYGIDPLNTPLWLLQVYERALSPLRYEEDQYVALAVRAAMADRTGWNKMMAQFERHATPYAKVETAVTPANEEVAQWFIDNGIPIG